MRLSTLSLCLVSIAGAPLGGVAKAEAASDKSVKLTETVSADVYSVQGSFDVDVGPHGVWQVLTDYGGLPSFEPNVRKSVAGKLAAGKRIVSQEFEGKALIFTRDMKVRLEVQEEPERSLAFRDVGHEDFEVYQGSWQIQSAPGGSKVRYRLRSKPKGLVPEAIVRGAIRDQALQMLRELRGEIVRRAVKAPLTQTASSKLQEGNAP